MTAASLGVPLDDFRTWIVLARGDARLRVRGQRLAAAVPRERLEQQLAGVLDQARSLQAGRPGRAHAPLREAKDNPLAAFMTPEQRGLFAETQLVMSLLEGFSDWVMDEVGEQVLPDVASIRQRFEARRRQRQRGVDRIIARLTGLDLKLEQYRRGERFVAGVAAAGGQAIGRLWARPALPSERSWPTRQRGLPSRASHAVSRSLMPGSPPCVHQA